MSGKKLIHTFRTKQSSGKLLKTCEQVLQKCEDTATNNN